MSRRWEALDPNQSAAPPDASKPFELTAKHKTDIWRPNSNLNDFNAPGIITRLKVGSFKSVSVTVSANWKTLYDQGGIILAFPDRPNGTVKDIKQWIKAGVEIFGGEPKIGVVGTYAFSDWSLSPMLDGSNKATFKAERKGNGLWIYVVKDGREVAVREVTWAFQEDRDGDAELWVGAYAAKPTAEEDDPSRGLEVTFEDLKVETLS